MAWSSSNGSYLPSGTIRDQLDGTLTLDFDGDTHYVALFDNTVTPNMNTDPQRYNTAPWNSGEVYGTGWAQGGVAIAAPDVTLVTDVGIMFDATDVSESSTTLSNAYGCIIYDYTSATDDVLVSIYFGGSPYSTNNGTFGIQWDTNGIFRIDLNPNL